MPYEIIRHDDPKTRFQSFKEFFGREKIPTKKIIVQSNQFQEIINFTTKKSSQEKPTYLEFFGIDPYDHEIIKQCPDKEQDYNNYKIEEHKNDGIFTRNVTKLQTFLQSEECQTKMSKRFRWFDSSNYGFIINNRGAIKNAQRLKYTNIPNSKNVTTIVCHVGGANEGHYFSYVKKGNQWYECNDNQITPVSEEEIQKITGITSYAYGQNTAHNDNDNETK